MLHSLKKIRYRFARGLLARWGAAFLTPHVIANICGLPRFLSQWYSYNRLAPHQILFQDSHPCLADRVVATPFDPHYFFQAAWLARRLQRNTITQHVDVGSSVMMHNVLSASLKITFVDYRPLRAHLSNFHSLAADIIRLPFRDASVASLSCLHVIEHVGLGRYGDPLNPEGSRLAAAELQRILQPGGHLFLSLPVGRERVCFNAHRVFGPNTVQEFFQKLHLESYSLVDDNGQFREDVSTDDGTRLEYGCGMFEFVRAAE